MVTAIFYQSLYALCRNILARILVSSRKCLKDKYICEESRMCIDKHLECDKFPHCLKNEDEESSCGKKNCLLRKVTTSARCMRKQKKIENKFFNYAKRVFFP